MGFEPRSSYTYLRALCYYFILRRKVLRQWYLMEKLRGKYSWVGKDPGEWGAGPYNSPEQHWLVSARWKEEDTQMQASYGNLHSFLPCARVSPID